MNGDVIDGILSEQKKEVDKAIINSAELEKYFGKDKTPREMKWDKPPHGHDPQPDKLAACPSGPPPPLGSVMLSIAVL